MAVLSLNNVPRAPDVFQGRQRDARPGLFQFDELNKRMDGGARTLSLASSSSGFLRSLVSGGAPGDAAGNPGGGPTKRTKLLAFLCINTCLMFVEFAYGAAHNNLGLLSDGCHMLFDNGSLAIGLYAAYMATLPADSVFTYGLGRVESLAGFANGVLLVFVALEITLESVERMMEPPDLTTDGLLAVSILGLVVNVIGLLCCQDAHGHGHSHGLGGGDSSSDSDSDDGCEDEDHNMRAIFLHILADTLGSVSVIISVLCIKYLGWVWADALASLFVSACCMASVLPLIGQTVSVLMLHTPASKAAALGGCSRRIEHLPGVAGAPRARFWSHNPGELCGAVRIEAVPGGAAGLQAGKGPAGLAAQARAIYERVRMSSLAVEVVEAPQDRPGEAGGPISIAMAELMDMQAPPAR